MQMSCIDKRVLAIEPTLGSAYLCGHCSRFHLELGEARLTTDLEGFQALVVLLNRAAANFELWAEAEREDGQ